MPDAVVAPGLALVRTDSEHYLPLTEAAYRFRPYRIGPEDLGRIHGTDERIGVREYATLIRFYVELLRGAALGATPR